ncbi:helix-turn-helix domain-containing protein [Streptomyces sp. NPDC048507]|uniref:helix-turn-helix domain-containing protein n=1 Tax=Streptomyces sp. NPDC048507 TaxID=3365560 RepID=UPI00371DB1E3
MTVSALCHGEGCRGGNAGGRPRRRTAGGGRLCRPCREHLDAGLGELAHLYEECGRVLGGASPGSLRERTSGGELPGLPFNGAAADVRARMISVLGSWSGLVAQQRGFAPPPRTVAGLTAFLLRNTDWLAAHPAAGEASEEIARLVRAGRRAAFPDPARTVRLGGCPEPGCPGTLALSVRAATPADGPAIVCEADPGHRWTSEQWSALSEAMGSGRAPGAPAPATERWLTAADIAQLWRTPTGTVYRLASEQRWRRQGRAGRTYYHEGDVRACFERRAAARA